MSNRFSRVRQGGKYKVAMDNYIQYLQGIATRPSRVGTRGAQPRRIPLYLTPFGFDIPTDQIYEARATEEDYNFLSPQITPHAEVLNAPGSKEAVKRRGFKAARIVFFGNSARSVTVVKSDITKMDYLKYNGERRSCPFGRKAVDDDLNDVFGEIRAALNTQYSNYEVRRISLDPERLSY